MLRVGDVVEIKLQTGTGVKKLKVVVNWLQFGVTFVAGDGQGAYEGFTNVYHQGTIRKNDAIAMLQKDKKVVTLLSAKKKVKKI